MSTLPPSQAPSASEGTFVSSPQESQFAAPLAGWSPAPGLVPAIPYPHAAPGSAPPPMWCTPCAPCFPQSSGKYIVPAQQPVIPVPIHQEVIMKDRIVEVDRTVITDKLVPRVHHQEVHHEVPSISMQYKDVKFPLKRVEYTVKQNDIEVPIGYNFIQTHKWEVREVPKIVPKYVGEQRIINVDVPQVKIVDKYVEREVPVYVGERTVVKTVYEEEPYEEIEYEYVEQEEEVPVYKYKPVFDVEVDLPPPLLVPVHVEPEKVHAEPERMTLSEYRAMKKREKEKEAKERAAAAGGRGVCCCGPSAERSPPPELETPQLHSPLGTGRSR
eukprot:Polyplicarium_translucidae@DN1942_c0_g1_i1.p1